MTDRLAQLSPGPNTGENHAGRYHPPFVDRQRPRAPRKTEVQRHHDQEKLWMTTTCSFACSASTMKRPPHVSGAPAGLLLGHPVEHRRTAEGRERDAQAIQDQGTGVPCVP